MPTHAYTFQLIEMGFKPIKILKHSLESLIVLFQLLENVN